MSIGESDATVSRTVIVPSIDDKQQPGSGKVTALAALSVLFLVAGVISFRMSGKIRRSKK